MRRLLCSCLLPVMAVTLYGCISKETTPNVLEPGFPTATALPVVAPTVETPPPSPTSIPSTATPRPTQTATLMPPATLVPQQAEASIRELLQEPECLAPCFWGIIPGQTTFDEAKNIVAHLGLQLEHTNTRDNKDFYESGYEFDNGLSVAVVLAIQDERVTKVNVYINPERPEDPETPREWLAYSPETLIKQYGTPSKVDIFGTMSGEQGDSLGLAYGVNMYFDAVDLIVEYYSAYDYVKIDPTTGLVRICPLTDQFQAVRIWPGKDPQPEPSAGILLEEATSMTLEEFSELMTGEADNACFDLSKEIFY